MASKRAAVGKTTAKPIKGKKPSKPEGLTDLPELGPARIIETVFPDGLWHHRFGVARDNTGDGQVGILVEGDRKRRVLMMRTGTPPVGGVFWEQPYLNSIYEGWIGNQQEPPVKGLPGLEPHSHINIDTHCWVQNPYTGVVTFIHSARPGNRPAGAGGAVYALQRATSVNPSAAPSRYTRFPNELMLVDHPDAPWEQPIYYPRRNEYFGGVQEPAILYDVFLDKFVLFYTGKTREAPDAFGQRHRSRIGRALADPTGFDEKPEWIRSPAAGPESYVFDSRRDGAGGEYGDTDATAVWGTANTVLQQHVSIDPMTGRYHLIVNGKKPSTRGGQENASIGYGHYWSDDQGDHWTPDARNPVATWQSLGWEDIGVANRLNSPHIVWDTWAMKGYLCFWGNEVGRVNKLGTRLYAIEFDL